jgi:predicted Zn-dependent protease
MDIYARLCNASNHFPHFRYYVLAVDNPVVFTSIDGQLFISHALLDESSKYYCSDDEVAAILSHELAHLEHCHLLQHIEHQKLYRLPDIEIQKPNASGIAATAGILASGALFHTSSGTWKWTTTALYIAYDLIRPKDAPILKKIAHDITLYSNYGFNMENEIEADNRACELLRNAGYAQSALSSVLNKQLVFIMNDDMSDNRSKYVENLVSRINKISSK